MLTKRHQRPLQQRADDVLHQDDRHDWGDVHHPDAWYDPPQRRKDRLGYVEQQRDEKIAWRKVEPGEQGPNDDRQAQNVEQKVDEIDERFYSDGRSPKIARPTRTMVAPSSIACG